MSLRGWGETEFRHASLEMVEAARFALYAERLVPVLAGAEQVLATEFTQHMSPQDMSRLGRAKLVARQSVPAIRALLFPAD